MFDFESMNQMQSQGESILSQLNIPKDMTIRMKDLVSSDMINNIRSKFKAQQIVDTCLMRVFDSVWEMERIKIAELIELVIPCTSPETFTLSKNYTIKYSLDSTKGKWPEQLGNGFYTEGTYLLDDLIEMVKKAILKGYKESEQKENIEQTLEELTEMLRKYTDSPDFINQYSMQILGKLEDRDEQYVYY